MTDKEICDAIGKQAALAIMFAMWAKMFTTVACTARAKHFHDLSLRFTNHTLRLIATHRTVVEKRLKEIS